MADVRYKGPVVEITAGENLGGHRVVIASNGEAFYADSSDADDVGLVRGITVGAANDGDLATVQVYGPMVEPSWTWTPDLPIYFTSSGVLTQTLPTSGFLQQVAVAETATKIFIDLQIPIVL